ncbi:hypothetical protein ACO22_00032 [Paracoccidioides brasiliensis]|uniref:Uncharacterized protein n=1 Tax=Paracoccidioides brasiliensis TaxID=121759 RepID=A0A1D2JQK1_PARBR|nr:hypothetical protein ACO22_00032 [Paracoccidioides brasiliensis]
MSPWRADHPKVRFHNFWEDLDPRYPRACVVVGYRTEMFTHSRSKGRQIATLKYAASEADFGGTPIYRIEERDMAPNPILERAFNSRALGGTSASILGNNFDSDIEKRAKKVL